MRSEIASDMGPFREGCCADWPKPCSYHEGWQEALDAVESASCTNYTDPAPSVECAYPPCKNRLRRADIGGPQWCSKEHREANNAPSVKRRYGVRWMPTWPHVSLGLSAHVWPPKFAHLSLHLPVGVVVVGFRGKD